MKFAVFCFLILLCSPLFAFQSIVVLPLNNESEKQYVYWLGEGFAESLSEELLLQDAYVIQRTQRKAAYDALRLPYTGDVSRATMLRIAHKLSADYVVFGSYNLKDTQLSVEARVIRLPEAELSGPIQAKGKLEDLYQLQTSLRDGLVNYFATRKLLPIKLNRVHQPVPLHAYEMYIKGLMESADAERVKFFQRALVVYPDYQEAALRLGQAYTRMERYKESNDTLEKAKFDDAILKVRADFLIALNHYFLKEYDEAYNRWLELSKSYPTAEVFNDLGLAILQKNDPAGAGWYLSKAVELDPKAADYRFNLACSYSDRQYNKQAMQQFQQVVQTRPNDYQAVYMIGKLLQSERDDAVAKRVLQISQEMLPPEARGKFPDSYTSPLQLLRPAQGFLTREERQYGDASLERTMDEWSSYLKTYQANAKKFVETAAPDQAVLEIKKGLIFKPFDWYLHYLWGEALAQQKNKDGSIAELNFSLWCQDNLESHLLLADLYRQEAKYSDAKTHVQRSLALDPNNKRAKEIWNTIWNKE